MLEESKIIMMRDGRARDETRFKPDVCRNSIACVVRFCRPPLIGRSQTSMAPVAVGIINREHALRNFAEAPRFSYGKSKNFCR
jgi:hypothetical protein